MKKLFVVAITLICVAAQAETECPLKRVVLFTSGVGYFERHGEVTADAPLALNFREDQINDFIKSVVIQDRGEGAVSVVTYDSRDPIDRTLRSFAVDLSDNPGLYDILQRIRGARLRVYVSATELNGRVVSVERHTRVADGLQFDVEHLNLATADGLRSIALTEIQSIEILDEAIARDMQAALDVLVRNLDRSRKQAQLSFTGGPRSVSVGYMLEAPLWKASYRLVRREDGVLLQGWAHVENQLDEDWQDVELTLVSGRPISFIQNLYDPIYVKRPEVKQELHEGVVPPEHKARPTRASHERAGVPAMAITGFSAAPDDPWSDWGEGMDLHPQVTSAESGELFTYRIAEPVSVMRQQSAMIPVVNTMIEGEALSIYNATTHARHPMNGLEIRNTSDLQLMAGPVTVIDEGVYAGDARLPHTQAGETRLLSYALDLACDVSMDPAKARGAEEIVSLKLASGILTVRREMSKSVGYFANNQRDRERTLIIEHAIQAGWDLVEPAKEIERTPEHYRFRIAMPAKGSTELTVTEKRLISQTISISSLRSDQIEIYLRAKSISKPVQAALSRILSAQTELADQRKALSDLDQSLVTLERDQERTRKNMEASARPSDTYATFERRLLEQDREIQRLRKERDGLALVVRKKEAELQAYIMELDVE